MKTNLNFLSNVRTACIISHENPDVDALASSVVFANFLETEFHIKADIFADFKILSDCCKVIVKNKAINPVPKKYDVAIILDCPNSLRLGKFKTLYDSANRKIVIDHHATNNNFGDVNIMSNVSSCCEIIYSILNNYNYCFTDEDCKFIYGGIATDTSNFTVGNFNHKTFEIVAKLAKRINVRQAYQEFFANDLKNLSVFAKAIDRCSCFENEQIVFSDIPIEIEKSLKLQPNNYEGVINKLNTIKNSKFICFVYPKNNKKYVSLRCKEGFNVAEIALKNGGGGHVGAAAFETDSSFEEIKNNLLKEFKKQLKSNKK